MSRSNMISVGSLAPLLTLWGMRCRPRRSMSAFGGKAEILRSGPVYGRLEVCYPFGRKHAREHMFDSLAHRLLSWPCMTESSPTEQTNALLAAVVASSMDAVFSIDTNARIQTWNSAAEQLYGYTAAEAIGQPLG